ncbi:hypothetical protein DPMN_014903 [Dreissena polymorpha]|uniref:Apple domain-containing protein n=1 Tax=Dreissena polymorpha TaxID=45954 RepID=A0A9D4NBP8_DREPO|nr:hypothetical protein DPMN_014903 [Dreissena polymorpha]
MLNTPESTVFKVGSSIECAFICLRRTEQMCVTAQFEKATQNCELFNRFEHTYDPSHEKATIVFKFAARFFT